MFQNNIKEESSVFFSINVDKDMETTYFHMNLLMINNFTKLLSVFSKQSEVVLNESTFLILGEMKECFPVREVKFQYMLIDSDDLVVNFSFDKKCIYIFGSEEGINHFIDCLLCLKEGLEKGRPEDISYMIEEWGGRWLLNKRVIEGSAVICHLRLYGILG